MPKLWNDTIAGHRQAVRGAILDATAALVAAHGLAGVSMSQIAQATAIGRATLYKYFPDVEAIMAAWHERQIAAHLHQLARVRAQSTDAGQALRAVLQAYAHIQHQHHGHELAALLHRGAHMAHARRHLHRFLTELTGEAAATGQVRGDVPPGELADFCLNALAAAASLPSKAAVGRLVTLTLTALGPA